MDNSYQQPAPPQKKNTTLIIIIVVAVVLLLCCCCIASIYFGYDPVMNLLKEQGIISSVSGLFI